MIGIDRKKEKKRMPEKLIAYKRMPLWTKDTMPEAVQRKHNTKIGTWGKITVLKGKLKFVELTENGEEVASHVFEAGADKLCSVIVSVVADFDIRLERITKRDGISAELAKKRFSSQHTMEFFKAHSDFVIENNGSVNDTFQKTCEVIETIKERYNGG